MGAIDKKETHEVISSCFKQIRDLGFCDWRAWVALTCIYCHYLLRTDRKGEAQALLREYSDELAGLREVVDGEIRRVADLLNECA
jgi:hypothetical protein